MRSYTSLSRYDYPWTYSRCGYCKRSNLHRGSKLLAFPIIQGGILDEEEKAVVKTISKLEEVTLFPI